MEISLVKPEHIEMIWPHIHDYMKGAAQYTYGRFESEDIKAGLEKQQVWIAFEENKVFGAVVTEILTYPRMTTLMMHFTGGIELKRWKKPMLETLQRYGKEKNCDLIESYGRSGWGKVFKNDGFKERFMFYELPI